MNRKKYILIAILLSAIMTILQSFVANMTIKSRERIIYAAKTDIAKGEIIADNMIEKITIYTDLDLRFPEIYEITGKTALQEIPKNSIFTIYQLAEGDFSIYDRYLSLSIDNSNFNAGDIKEGDIVDLFIIPDLKKMDEFEVKWLVDRLSIYGVAYVPGAHGGILLEDIEIEYIYQHSGQGKRIVSLKLKKPLDETISFLKTVSVIEFIKK